LVQFFDPSLAALVNCDKPHPPFVKSPLMVHEALAAISMHDDGRRTVQYAKWRADWKWLHGSLNAGFFSNPCQLKSPRALVAGRAVAPFLWVAYWILFSIPGQAVAPMARYTLKVVSAQNALNQFKENH
jgi:hypothetical protein